MQNEISIKPLVNILSSQLNKVIVGKNGGYAELGTNYVVSQEDIDKAITEQNSDYLEELKQKLKQQVEYNYQKTIQEPITYNINNTDYIFQADDKTQNILSKVIISTSINFQIDWLDIDNNLVHMTLDNLKKLAQIILQREEILFQKKIKLKNQIYKTTNEDELNEINILE